MEKKQVGTYLLMIAVATWGVLLGGVVYSNTIVMPAFLAELPASASVVNGPYAVNEVPFWMFIHPITILSLITALVMNWNNHLRRKLIAMPLGVYIAILILTGVFFVPELLAFSASQHSYTSAAEWTPRVFRWRMLSWIRAGFMFALFIPLLFALVDSGRSSGNDGGRFED